MLRTNFLNVEDKVLDLEVDVLNVEDNLLDVEVNFLNVENNVLDVEDKKKGRRNRRPFEYNAEI